jgi:hypothetical protein
LPLVLGEHQISALFETSFLEEPWLSNYKRKCPTSTIKAAGDEEITGLSERGYLALWWYAARH